MIPKLEGAIRPGAGISFDAQNTMHGGYAEATPDVKHQASLAVVSHVTDKPAARGVLDMLGLLPPRPQEGDSGLVQSR